MIKLGPRQVPSRDDYYMGEAFMVAAKSKDPNTQVGCRIVSWDNKPISTGYNGPPPGINDEDIDWSRPAKYPFIIHAEDNAIKFAAARYTELSGSTLYVTGPPCKACMLDIVSAGIIRVVYFPPQKDTNSLLNNVEEWQVTKEIARLGLVDLEEFTGSLRWLHERIVALFKGGVFDDQSRLGE